MVSILQSTVMCRVTLCSLQWPGRNILLTIIGTTLGFLWEFQVHFCTVSHPFVSQRFEDGPFFCGDLSFPCRQTRSYVSILKCSNKARWMITTATLSLGHVINPLSSLELKDLPRLPVPALKHTLSLYLEQVDSHVSFVFGSGRSVFLHLRASLLELYQPPVPARPFGNFVNCCLLCAQLYPLVGEDQYQRTKKIVDQFYRSK